MSEKKAKTENKHTGLPVLKEFGLGFLKQLSAKDIGTYAASATFFTFLSLLPVLILKR